MRKEELKSHVAQTVSLKNMFDSIAISPTFPSEGSRCAGGLQGGRRHGGEDVSVATLSLHHLLHAHAASPADAERVTFRSSST